MLSGSHISQASEEKYRPWIKGYKTGKILKAECLMASMQIIKDELPRSAKKGYLRHN